MRTSSRDSSRAVDGVLLLDKPTGFSSNQALQQAKRLLDASKAGHTGSLDPIASGLLPLCFGEATKVSQFLLDAEKRYAAVLRLGATTATFDVEGEVLLRRPIDVTAQAIERTLRAFEGDVEQTPPMYSALKHNGQPLYELARRGIEVERAPRRVRIRAIELQAFEGDRVALEVTCSKGTYIRTLAHDIGERLGCGAYVEELRRLAVGSLSLDRALTLDALAALPGEARAARLLPADRVLDAIPDVRLTPLATHYLVRGQAVSVQHRHRPGWVRLYDEQERFLGMGEVLDDGRVAPRRLLAQKT